MVLGRPTLRQLVDRSACVVLARLESDVSLWRAPDGSDRQDHYRALRLEVLKGEAPPEHFAFFPHAEGLPDFGQGDRVLLFLERSAEHAGFATLAARFPWFSTQQVGDEWRVPGDASGEAILVIARRVVGLASLPDARRDDAWREILLAELGSGIVRLRDDALGELARRGGAALLHTPEHTAAFAAYLKDTALPLTDRLLLLRTLSGAPGFDAPGAWEAILAEPHPGDDLLALLRAAAAGDDVRLSRFVASRLADPDPVVRREAARALAHPRHAAHHAALAQLARGPDAQAARAAIQALGALGSEAARADLETLAGELGPERRRWAEAELRRRRAPRPKDAAESAPTSGPS